MIEISTKNKFEVTFEQLVLWRTLLIIKSIARSGQEFWSEIDEDLGGALSVRHFFSVPSSDSNFVRRENDYPGY